MNATSASLSGTTARAPAVAMLRLLGGFQISQALYVTARAGVADELAAGPRPVGAVAEATGLRPDLLRRLLRSLAAERVFAYDEERDSVALGPLGHTLRGGTDESVREVALMWMETHYRPFGRLWSTLHDGVPAAERELGRPFFDWLGEDPDRVAGFSAAMADLMRAVRRDAIDALDLTGVRHLVDIGGADGTCLAALAGRHPWLRGTVFDLPHVVPAAHDTLRRAGVADRVDTRGGDFFQAVPEGADAYLACFVLHDWNDEQSTRILERVHEAAAPGARLLLVETVLGRGPAPEIATMLDLTMMGIVDGRERTLEDWRSLLAGAGFRLTRAVETASPMCVVEAVRTDR
ncbi:methyltransferase [Streptomyces flavofungini]|uniref:methyltransferase n=1 Tax=Streptomyces flavofungini TaxID=68200 RepID=UPI0025B267E0|nr:methyltransferase [Streptomyces flavofungini]WJV44688.1 methyltransferase [Streptomyces flavofungini]